MVQKATKNRDKKNSDFCMVSRAPLPQLPLDGYKCGNVKLTTHSTTGKIAKMVGLDSQYFRDLVLGRTSWTLSLDKLAHRSNSASDDTNRPKQPPNYQAVSKHCTYVYRETTHHLGIPMVASS